MIGPVSARYSIDLREILDHRRRKGYRCGRISKYFAVARLIPQNMVQPVIISVKLIEADLIIYINEQHKTHSHTNGKATDVYQAVKAVFPQVAPGNFQIIL